MDPDLHPSRRLTPAPEGTKKLQRNDAEKEVAGAVADKLKAGLFGKKDGEKGEEGGGDKKEEDKKVEEKDKEKDDKK